MSKPTILLCGANQNVTGFYKGFIRPDIYRVLETNPVDWQPGQVFPDICILIGKLPSECWDDFYRVSKNGSNIKFLFIFESNDISGLPGSNIFLVNSIINPGVVINGLSRVIGRILNNNGRRNI